MKKLSVWRALVVAVMAGLAPCASTLAQQAEHAAAPPPANMHEVMVPMRDGVQLAANVYMPAIPCPCPVVLTRTPYIKDNDHYLAPEHWRRYTDAGYVFVEQDVRGKGHSQGFYRAFENDMADGYDTVEWVAQQSWSNGRVGMSGASAMGITTNLAAVANPPHLVAAYVIVAPSGRRLDSIIGGVSKDADNSGWLREQGVSEEIIARARERVRDGQIDEANEMQVGRRFIDIPMYNVGGWYDIFAEGAVGNFEFLQNHGLPGARGNQKLFMGPFGHGPLSGDLEYPGFDRLALQSTQEIRWFDYWLKGVDNGIMAEPPVTYFMMGAARKGAASVRNRILHAANWPPASRATNFYLGPNLSLARTAPTVESARISYRFNPASPVPTVGGANLTFDRGPMDQRAIPQRQDYLRFQTPPLTEDVVITGDVRADLWVATDGPDTDFMVKLVDVYPDGYEAIVLDAPLRTRYRNGFGAEDVAMMVPNAPTHISIDLWSTAITFERGHSIALHITSSSAPRFEVNPNTGDAPNARPRTALNTIFLDRTHPSALVLPLVYPEN